MNSPPFPPSALLSGARTHSIQDVRTAGRSAPAAPWSATTVSASDTHLTFIEPQEGTAYTAPPLPSFTLPASSNIPPSAMATSTGRDSFGESAVLRCGNDATGRTMPLEYSDTLPSTSADGTGISLVSSSGHDTLSGLVNQDEARDTFHSPVFARGVGCPSTAAPVLRTYGDNQRLPLRGLSHDSILPTTGTHMAHRADVSPPMSREPMAPNPRDGTGLPAAATACSRSLSRGNNLEPTVESSVLSTPPHEEVVPSESHLHSDSPTGVNAGVETSSPSRNRVPPFIPSNLAMDANLTQNSVRSVPHPSAHSVSAEFDVTREYSTADMILFWQPPSVYSQWTPSSFTVDGVSYNCAEQFFAAEKLAFLATLVLCNVLCGSLTPAFINVTVEQLVVSTQLFGTLSVKISF